MTKYFSYLLLLFGCCIFPIGKLYDTILSPKWYFAAIMILIIVWIATWNSYRGKTADTDRIKKLSVLALIVLTYSLLYAIMVDGLALIPAFAPHYPMQGVFDNPSGYSLNTCILLSLSLWKYKERTRNMKLAIIAVFILSCITIWLTGNRTGLLCISMLLIICIFKDIKIKSYLKYSIINVIICGFVFYSYNIKQASTSGRQFIIERTVELIGRHPLTGYGIYGFEREYMPNQAEFFHNNPKNKNWWSADEIRHPLNEFLYLWVNFGILAPITLLIFFLLPFIVYIKTRDPVLCLCITPFAVVFIFALFSYPSKYPLSYIGFILPYVYLISKYTKYLRINAKLVFTAVTIACVISMTLIFREFVYERQWSRLNRIMMHGGSMAVISRYDELYSHYQYNPYFLYSYMITQYKSGQCHRSVITYKKLKAYRSTYDMELLVGDTFRHMGRYYEALIHYRMASEMCPVRISPLAGILDTYIDAGNITDANDMAEKILARSVKVQSYMVTEIRNHAEEWLLQQQIVKD